MLTKNDYNHIKLLYDQFFKMSEHIRSLILEGDLEAVEVAIADKDELLKKIYSFEKTHTEEIKSDLVLHTTRLRLVSMESENLEILKSLKTEVQTKMKQAKTAKKILNTYEPETSNSVSTLEIKEED